MDLAADAHTCCSCGPCHKLATSKVILLGLLLSDACTLCVWLNASSSGHKIRCTCFRHISIYLFIFLGYHLPGYTVSTRPVSLRHLKESVSNWKRIFQTVVIGDQCYVIAVFLLCKLVWSCIPFFHVYHCIVYPPTPFVLQISFHIPPKG